MLTIFFFQIIVKSISLIDNRKFALSSIIINLDKGNMVSNPLNTYALTFILDTDSLTFEMTFCFFLQFSIL